MQPILVRIILRRKKEEETQNQAATNRQEPQATEGQSAVAVPFSIL